MYAKQQHHRLAQHQRHFSMILFNLITFASVTLGGHLQSGEQLMQTTNIVASHAPSYHQHQQGGAESTKRFRRDNGDMIATDLDELKSSESFENDEKSWSTINEQVDLVIPLVLQHLATLQIDHLELPEMKEELSLNSLFLNYKAGLYLYNGIVYNLEGIKRYGDAMMTYESKSFVCRFNLLITSLQFEYNFLLQLMTIEGQGKVIGSLDDTIIKAELAIGISNISLHLNDFRIVGFSNINVQLDERGILRQLTGLILSPITNLFKDRITTSISDGLKEQMQALMNDFNNKDPLELQTFAKKMLGGLTGDKE